MTTLASPRVRWTAERTFYAGMALAVLSAVFLGFSRSFFLRPLFPGHRAPPEAFFYVHGAVARWPFDFMKAGPPAFLGVTDLFLVPLVVWDLATRRRLHPATLWAGLAVLASQPFRLWVSGTAAWLAFARWATGLGG